MISITIKAENMQDAKAQIDAFFSRPAGADKNQFAAYYHADNTPAAATPTTPYTQPVAASAQSVIPFPVPQQPPVAPTQAPTYTEDDLMRAAGILMDSGKVQQLQQLLASMGVQYLGQLPKERYGEFAMALKNLGAKL